MRISESRVGKIPTTLVRRLISLCSRSRGLEECWRPSFARSLVPRYTALRHDLDAYLDYYNFDRAHTGRHTNGRIPARVLGARKMRLR
jgi:hypothetical protein